MKLNLERRILKYLIWKKQPLKTNSNNKYLEGVVGEGYAPRLCIT